MTQPSVGRIVQYVLSADDADVINRRRVPRATAAAPGVMFHVGNSAKPGDVFPLLVCRIWVSDMVNGQVFLDGSDTLWVTSRHEGTEPGTWHWPVREEEKE